MSGSRTAAADGRARPIGTAYGSGLRLLDGTRRGGGGPDEDIDGKGASWAPVKESRTSWRVWPRTRRRRERDRARRLLGAVPERRGWRSCVPCGAARPAQATGVGLLVVLAVGGATGLLLGAVTAVLCWRRARPRPTGAAPELRQAAAELPLAAELLAACLAAGADPVGAAGAVGSSLGGPIGSRLSSGAAELRLGGSPTSAWRALSAVPGASPLVRLLGRAGESGAPAAEAMTRLAETIRAERSRRALAAARRASVLVAAPVGLCVLPAFLVLGVLPVLVGLAGGLLHAAS